MAEAGGVTTLGAGNTGFSWGTADNLYHLARDVSGNFIAYSYTVGSGGTHDGWSRYGGVHVRDSTAAGAKSVSMTEIQSWAGSAFIYRLTTDDVSAAVTDGDRFDYNAVLRMGGIVEGYHSADAATWTQIGTPQVMNGGLTDPVRVGPLLAGGSGFAHNVTIGWFWVRQYVRPEPTAALGLVEVP